MGNKLEITNNIRRLRFFSDEMTQLLSNVRLGVSMGMIENVEITQINQLMNECGSASIMRQTQTENPADRDRIRASIVRKTLNNN